VPQVSQKAAQFTESVIREMTRLCVSLHGDRCVNLAQGFPDFAAPEGLKEAAIAAIRADHNQYATTWGAKVMRDAIAKKVEHFYSWRIDPEQEITVCCGATEAMMATILALVNPGDEVVIFSPYYENYGPDCILTGAVPRWVPLQPPTWSFDPEELRRAFGPRTRAIIVNTPHNPTGKVFTRGELASIAALCQEHDALAITDEIYEHLVYRGQHVPIATLPGMRERTVTISGLSKTYSVTGWRLAYAIAPALLTGAIRKVHDFLTVGAPHPLQVAAATALGWPDDYYARLLRDYQQRRDFLLEILDQAGFKTYPPDGAYYVMTDISGFGKTDVELGDWLIRERGVATVPGSSFYHDPALGRHQVRFSFPKRMETLRRAAERLSGLRVPGA
jgi:aminotransferase